MKIMKFGGTSVGSVKAVQQVKQIVESSNEEVIVVVSALGGITDQLLQSAKMASAGDLQYEAELEKIVARHHEMVKEVVLPACKKEVDAVVTALLDELTNIFRGVHLIKDLSEKTNDTIVSYGERLSSAIMAGVLEGSALCDSREFIKTKRYFSKHNVDFERTNTLVHKVFSGLPKISVVPGFIATDVETGDVTNLGRGGSDYTAAILAAALDARILEIWTDVDGFMTADPRMINNAYVIERLSFVEAMELSNFGARVIYPPTIFPVYHSNIPIVIKNTFNPSSPGTCISREKVDDPGRAIKGISSLTDTCLITIQGLGMVGVIGINYRIFKTLAKGGVSVFFVSQAASENTTSIGVCNADARHAVQLLSEEFEQEIAMGEINGIKQEPDLATVAIVGDNMKHTPGIAGKLFSTLGRNGINVIACAQGASETNISFVIEKESLRKAISVLHDSFFLSEYQVLNIFLVGTGTVGGSLLEQLQMQQPKLMKDNGLKINVVGIADVDRMIFDREGIDLSKYRELLAEGSPTTPEQFKEEIRKMNIFNSVFVDCTAAAPIAELYQDLLSSNVSVVTANKIAASGLFEKYENLKLTARKKGVKFLFETNVGAGLPVINTINGLINSGDRILKIEAVVSGTLNFIFNEMSDTVPFSRAVMMAKEAGYAEPDPRVDLSGTDVIRKLVILAREAGYQIEQSDVEKELFIPGNYFQGTVEDFWKNLPELDAEFERKRKEMEARGLRLRFIAEFDHGKSKVSLKGVDINSPFYNLFGSNNVISLTTERYREYPMQIKGYGAGAGVTAAGVFADIISIANIR